MNRDTSFNKKLNFSFGFLITNFISGIIIYLTIKITIPNNFIINIFSKPEIMIFGTEWIPAIIYLITIFIIIHTLVFKSIKYSSYKWHKKNDFFVSGLITGIISWLLFVIISNSFGLTTANIFVISIWLIMLFISWLLTSTDNYHATNSNNYINYILIITGFGLSFGFCAGCYANLYYGFIVSLIIVICPLLLMCVIKWKFFLDKQDSSVIITTWFGIGLIPVIKTENTANIYGSFFALPFCYIAILLSTNNTSVILSLLIYSSIIILFFYIAKSNIKKAKIYFELKQKDKENKDDNNENENDKDEENEDKENIKTYNQNQIVIDKIFGMLITCLPLLFIETIKVIQIIILFISFLLFLFFSITKPWPVKHFNKQNNSIDMIINNGINGIYSAGSLTLIWLFITKLTPYILNKL